MTRFPQYRYGFREMVGAILIMMGLSVLVWAVVSDQGKPNDKVQVSTTPETAETRAERGFPAYVRQASPEIRRAYRFASDVRSRSVLSAIDCYCGCEESNGHASLLECYVKQSRSGNQAVFVDHAVNCMICLKEAWDVESLLSRGKSIADVKAKIDITYGAAGRP